MEEDMKRLNKKDVVEIVEATEYFKVKDVVDLFEIGNCYICKCRMEDGRKTYCKLFKKYCDKIEDGQDVPVEECVDMFGNRMNMKRNIFDRYEITSDTRIFRGRCVVDDKFVSGYEMDADINGTILKDGYSEVYIRQGSLTIATGYLDSEENLIFPGDKLRIDDLKDVGGIYQKHNHISSVVFVNEWGCMIEDGEGIDMPFGFVSLRFILENANYVAVCDPVK